MDTLLRKGQEKHAKPRLQLKQHIQRQEENSHACPSRVPECPALTCLDPNPPSEHLGASPGPFPESTHLSLRSPSSPDPLAETPRIRCQGFTEVSIRSGYRDR